MKGNIAIDPADIKKDIKMFYSPLNKYILKF